MEKTVYRNEWLINLNDAEKIKRFVELSKDVPFDIDLCSVGRPVVIDAKSIMGILSLDLSIPHKLCTSFTGPDVDSYKEAITEFLV